jgi:addiction module RelE/StbE family toxin
LFELDVDDDVLRAWKKLSKKDRVQAEAVTKKVEQILLDPYQFKPLKHPLENQRRVHVGTFVIVYEIHENLKLVKILKYCHHDKAYKFW